MFLVDAVCNGARTRVHAACESRAQWSQPHSVLSAIAGGVEMGIGRDLLVSLDVNVNTAVETLVVEAVLGAGVEAVLTAFFEAVLAAGVAAVVLKDADFLFSADAGGTATLTVVFSGDADVLADALLVTGRAGLLGLRLLLLFPSSALDRYLLFSLDDLFGLLVVFVGRRKDAERDSGRALADVPRHVFGGCWRCAMLSPLRTFDAHQLQHALQDGYSRDSGVEIQPGDFGGSRVLCKTATRLAKQTRPDKEAR